jgi:hypothetical protein
MDDLENLLLLSKLYAQDLIGEDGEAANLNSSSSASGYVMITKTGVLATSSARATDRSRDSSSSKTTITIGTAVGFSVASATISTDRTSADFNPVVEDINP